MSEPENEQRQPFLTEMVDDYYEFTDADPSADFGAAKPKEHKAHPPVDSKDPPASESQTPPP